MTSEEIRNHKLTFSDELNIEQIVSVTAVRWLKEIAYQLAVMNEREEKQYPVGAARSDA